MHGTTMKNKKIIFMHVLVGLSFSQDGDYHCFTVLHTQYHILRLWQ